MPTILLPRVQIPSAPSTLSIIIKFVLYLSCEKNENKQKEAEDGPFKKQSFILTGNFPLQVVRR